MDYDALLVGVRVDRIQLVILHALDKLYQKHVCADGHTCCVCQMHRDMTEGLKVLREKRDQRPTSG